MGDVCRPITKTLLTQVRSTKFLGIFVDTPLDWKVHTNYSIISTKVAKNVYVPTRAFGLLPKTTRIMLYYTIISPYLPYCDNYSMGLHV